MSAHDIYLILILVLAGIAAGYTGGLFGVGGGVILVPVFLTVLPYFATARGVVMHMAVGTSLALLVPNTISATYRYIKAGNLEFDLCKRWLPFVVIGALFGAVILKYIPANGLKIIFTIYLYGSFLFVLLKKERLDNYEGKPQGWPMVIAGLFIGSLSVLLGIGGGTLTVPFSQIYHYPMHKAIAFSSATGIFIGTLGAISMIFLGWHEPGRPPFSLGFVNLLAFIIITPLVVFAAPYGVKTVHRLSKKHLRWIYAAFLLTVAIYMTLEVLMK